MANTLIKQIENEMNLTAQKLEDRHLTWREVYPTSSCEASELFAMSTEEIFDEVESITWGDIITLKNTRSIRFSRNGDIRLNKLSNLHHELSYTIDYNLFNKGFSFQSDDEQIIENSEIVVIKKGLLTWKIFKKSNSKKITYLGLEVNNSSINLELYLDSSNQLRKCYIDFRTHNKTNGKVNGTYLLRIVNDEDILRLNYVNSNGEHHNCLVSKFSLEDQELLTSLKGEELTSDKVYQLINTCLEVINSSFDDNCRQCIDLSKDPNLSTLLDLERKVRTKLKQIVEDVPLPSLEMRMKEFLSTPESIRKTRVPKLIF